ncbi:Brix domain-containing protein [Stetteria hydrogenophila]
MTSIIVTTSRAPSPRTRSFVKDLVAVLPGAERLTRGHLTLEELAIAARTRGADRVVVVGERRGNPSIIRVYEPTLGAASPLRNIVTFIVAGVALSRELGRPTPARPRRLLVAGAGDEELDEYVEAFIRAFNARLLAGGRKPRAGDVVVVLSKADDLVVAEFEEAGRRVGPRVKLRKPSRMIKGENEGWLEWWR